MKKINLRIDEYRVQYGTFATYPGDGNNGLFIIPLTNGNTLTIIASDGLGWDHVSVSIKGAKLPSWNEMNTVKDLFWDQEETVVQYHPKKSEYIDNAQVLHLWKKQGVDLELPPKIMLGIK